MENTAKLYKEIIKLTKENKELKKSLDIISHKFTTEKRRNDLLEEKCRLLEQNMELKIQERVQSAINMTTNNLTLHYKSIINKLEKRIAQLEKSLNTDSSNSSLPTSKNRIGKKLFQIVEKSLINL